MDSRLEINNINVRRNTDWNCPPWPGTIVAIYVLFYYRRAWKKYGVHKPPPMGRIWERSKGDAICPTNLPESSSLESILAGCVYHQEGPWVRMLARDNLETNPITIIPETVSHVAEQSSWVPSPSFSPPRHPFPIKFLVLSAHVSSWTIHFWVLDKSPLSGPGRGPPPLPAM